MTKKKTKKKAAPTTHDTEPEQPKRGRGRPKFSKDGPRPPDAPRRGRPPKDIPQQGAAESASPEPQIAPQVTATVSAEPASRTASAMGVSAFTPHDGIRAHVDPEIEGYYDDEEYTQEMFSGLDAAAHRALGTGRRASTPSPGERAVAVMGIGPVGDSDGVGTSARQGSGENDARAAPPLQDTSDDSQWTALERAVRDKVVPLFFSPCEVREDAELEDGYSSDSDCEDEGSVEPEQEQEIEAVDTVGKGKRKNREKTKGEPAVKQVQGNESWREKLWFKPPKYMPEWLQQWFAEVLGPALSPKDGKALPTPTCYLRSDSVTSPTLWIDPPDPILARSQTKLSPNVLRRPRILLWLTHCFAPDGILKCPRCEGKLEKNGMLSPRRITDLEDNFYLVSWGYYCRSGCKAHFPGWGKELLDSKFLSPRVRLGFPVQLSHRGGVTKRVLRTMRVCSQHKMGPTGMRALLMEHHTHRFDRIRLQYLESVYRIENGFEANQGSGSQSRLTSHMKLVTADFGNFWDKDGYAGYVPSERYLTKMLNRAIEEDEEDSNAFVASLAMDSIAVDDSYKITKHIAKEDNSRLFDGLWTCMDSHFIRGQVLTLTKAHDERRGALHNMAESLKKYGHKPPPVAFSDDPVKDKSLLCEAFPSLGENLAPTAKAYGLREVVIPEESHTVVLNSHELIETTLESLFTVMEGSTRMVVSLDAEWNVSRNTGVSIIQIAPHSDKCKDIYVIPVHKLNTLPPALLRILVSPNVYKVGSGIKGDFTRLKKQFSQLRDVDVNTLKLINLKTYCVQRGITSRSSTGGLAKLVEKTLGMFLPKEDSIRKCDDWERNPLRSDLLQYAAQDVYATKLVYIEAEKRKPLAIVDSNSPPGSRVDLFLQKDGPLVARGRISEVQPKRYEGVMVDVPTQSRLLIDVDEVVLPAASSILHRVPGGKSSKTKSGSYTYGQLRDIAATKKIPFQVVASINQLCFTCDTSMAITEPREFPSGGDREDQGTQLDESVGDVVDDDDLGWERVLNYEDGDRLPEEESDEDSDIEFLEMLEAYTAVNTPPPQSDGVPPELLSTEDREALKRLDEIVAMPPNQHDVFSRIKKDTFHAFNMYPIPLHHGMRVPFLRALRDHLFRWDPVARARVDRVCREKFKMSFDDMLRRRPRWILVRTPRYVPEPSVLVAALQFVYDMFADAIDSKTRVPLFTAAFKEKANSVLDLARQGYLSDLPDVPMYIKAGIDKYGLQKWRCIRGTNNLEGGPHGDIYRKFGALNAGVRLTVNNLTDHRTWYNLQAFAKFEYGVDWEYHHDLSVINRTAYLLNALSDSVNGADSYSTWMNTDLYEKTREQFGVVEFPESLRDHYSMQPYTSQFAHDHPLKSDDEWLRKRQGLAFPVGPPTTPEARAYFFSEVKLDTERAAVTGRTKLDLLNIARRWNSTADGIKRKYITAELLDSFKKSWERYSNSRASQDLVADRLANLNRSQAIFNNAAGQRFPEYLTASPTHLRPTKGTLIPEPLPIPKPPPKSHSKDHTRQRVASPTSSAMGIVVDAMDVDDNPPSHLPSITMTAADAHIATPFEIPPDIPGPSTCTATVPARSASGSVTPHLPSTPVFTFVSGQPLWMMPDDFIADEPTQTEPGASRPNKRRRVVPDERRKYALRSCRRCRKPDCPGSWDIFKCPQPCTTPCKHCGRVVGCKAVDNGRKKDCIEILNKRTDFSK
ncbi:hypothetical protein NMY22_g12013 [Coprinellus aureogranulatus]|nr:hypothetical protein NMY22_g12013 [Coprinellus aureogranulatus]